MSGQRKGVQLPEQPVTERLFKLSAILSYISKSKLMVTRWAIITSTFQAIYPRPIVTRPGCMLNRHVGSYSDSLTCRG